LEIPLGERGKAGSLLDALWANVRTDEGIEDGQDVAAIIHHARKNIAKLRIALGLAVPFDEYRLRHFDVSPQLLRGIATQKQAVEKGRLTLREVKIVNDFGGNELWHRGHRERCSLQKSASASSRTAVSLPRFVQLPLDRNAQEALRDAQSTTPWLPSGSNRLRMLVGMAKLHKSAKDSVAGNTVTRFLRFGVLRGLRSVEIDPEDFRRYLANKHRLWVPDFARMKDVPIERLDAIAKTLIRNAERVALAEGAGFGLGGMITFLPDASLLTVITLRLIQRLSLLYGFEVHGRDQRIEMWKAAAAASGIDYGKDLAEKQILERLAPRIAERFAAKLGAEAAEKWVGRLIPVASSAIGGALNFSFVRGWGRRVQRHLRARHLEAKAAAPPGAYTPIEAALV
jgi:uncharacterized protein (DUF697 family)